MALVFKEGIKVPTGEFIEKIGGSSYVSWATAFLLAGRPHQEVVLFDGNPYLPIFGGALVAVDAPLPSGKMQKTWLPVLANNAPISLQSLTSRDITDTIMRCRAKSAAMVNGVGLSVYAGFEGDAIGFLKALGIKPDSDLEKIEPLVEGKGGNEAAKYVPWAAALAAARITDPEFFWEVLEFDVTDPETGEVRRLPVASVASGWAVAVRVVYKSRTHTEWLPIMGVTEVSTKRGTRKMDHQPLATPTVFDWNKAVMRCLTKAIAVASGYGLGVYAGEDLESIRMAQKMAFRKPKPSAEEEQMAEPEEEQAVDEKPTLIGRLLDAIEKKGITKERILYGVKSRGWVDYQPQTLEELCEKSPEVVFKILEKI